MSEIPEAESLGWVRAELNFAGVPEGIRDAIVEHFRGAGMLAQEMAWETKRIARAMLNMADVPPPESGT